MVKAEVADFDRPCVAPPEPVFGRQTESLAMELYARARNIQTNPEFDLDLRKTFEIYTVDRATGPLRDRNLLELPGEARGVVVCRY
jgi:hypothetical protein